MHTHTHTRHPHRQDETTDQISSYITTYVQIILHADKSFGALVSYVEGQLSQVTEMFILAMICDSLKKNNL